MCGITGKIYHQQDRHVESEILKDMCRTLIHRGPDDDGYYLSGNVGLAMRRLSIIDLNTGAQPIHNEDRSIWVVNNGEIYNFPELRQNLEALGHSFYTNSDTEVLVHLYEEYGPDFVSQLNGMFALALWNEKNRQLILARDRLGIKPLFYSQLSDRFLFGSEIKAILADGLRPTIDFQSLSYYLSLLYIPAPFTIYDEIKKLKAGHILAWKNNQIDIRKYWDLKKIQALTVKNKNPQDLQTELRSLLRSSIRSRLISDVPLGVFLSGGLDSSTIVAMMRSVYNGSIKTFSIGFNDPSYNELPYARLIAKCFETDHAEIFVNPDIGDLVPKLVNYFDEPFADSSAIPTYYLSKLTRQHVKVALGGDGGDEIFAGYMTYKADKLALLYERLPRLFTSKLLPAVVQRLPVSDDKISFDFKAKRFVSCALIEPGRRHYAWKAFFDENLKKTVLSDGVLSSVEDYLDAYPIFQNYYNSFSHRDLLNRFLYTDAKIYLADDILVKVDRMSMANSLEVRVPLLDHQVVEFMFSLPGKVIMPMLSLKHFLKKTMSEILPRQIFKKPKSGFNVPIPIWLKKELRPLIQEYLSPTKVKSQGFFNPESILRLMNDHMNNYVDYSRNIWALLIFNLWYEKYVRR